MTTHGSYFVMAHFHYTIMGGLVFALMAGIYYWLPKMTGLKLNERLGKIHFWTMFIFFNLTFFPLFAAGMLGMPRRVSSYNAELHTLNVFVSVAGLLPRRLDAAVPRQPRLVDWCCGASAPSATRGSRCRSSGSCPRRCPVYNFERIPTITSDPYGYGVPDRAAGRRLRPARDRGRGGRGMSATETLVADPEDPAVLGANVAVGARLLASARRVPVHGVRVRVLLPARAEHEPRVPSRPHQPAGRLRRRGARVRARRRSRVVRARAPRARRRPREPLADRRARRVAARRSPPSSLQAIEYFNLSFGAATGGGFGSVFFGFTAVFAIFWLGAVYWIETMWAQSLRQPATAAGEVARAVARSCARAPTRARPSST